jgi:uncharacterized NAD-dependent epimerase/dehydratase family protein
VTRAPAIVLANGLYRKVNAKTSHGLVRSSARFEVLGVIDPTCAGADAGELLDGRRRGIPVLASVADALAATSPRPTHCVVGVATAGGVLPPELRVSLVEAIEAGLTVVNGLHRLLSEDAELAALAARRGTAIVDIRRPRPVSELRFWSGAIARVGAPRIPVLGTDCATGKRTTALLLRDGCRAAGLKAEMIYTGQSGWLQGMAHGFMLDATPNDFVCGELERAVVDCWEAERPDVIFIEGQSALRNPSGPCGSELLLGALAAGAVLQHPPARERFIDNELGCRIPPVAEEIALIRMYGVPVWAVTLNTEGLDLAEARRTRDRLRGELGLPVALPLEEGVRDVVEAIRGRLGGNMA